MLIVNVYTLCMAQYVVLAEEQQREMEALREEMEQSTRSALQQLSMDDETRRVVDQLTADNARWSDKNGALKASVHALQARICRMQSEVEQFKGTVSRRLQEEVRPAVVALHDECGGLKRGYQEVVSKYRQVTT